MIALWIAAALISAAAAVLIVQRAAIAARADPAEDSTLAVYRRQLKELDELTDHDLLPAAERKSARAEAARRLLSAADETTSPLEGRGGLGLVIAAAAVAPLAAAAIYLFLVGSPQIHDQPFKARLAAWRAADPQSLDPAQLAAVLQDVVAQRPNDFVPLTYLARTEMAEGDGASAVYDMKRAIRLAPNRADLWAMMGEMLSASDDPDDMAKARAAFVHANALDPKAPGPRYFLARDQITAGQVQAGLAAWKALAADLPANDPRRPALLQQIAQVQAGGAPGAEAAPQQPQAAAGGDQGAFIRAMVQRLADQLAAQPNDPQGWGRLIHAYGVLGDDTQRSAALARAQALFKDRPDAWRAVQQAEAGPS